MKPQFCFVSFHAVSYRGICIMAVCIWLFGKLCCFQFSVFCNLGSATHRLVINAGNMISKSIFIREGLLAKSLGTQHCIHMTGFVLVLWLAAVHPHFKQTKLEKMHCIMLCRRESMPKD